MYCILPCTWIGWLTSRKRALYPFALFISIFKNHFFYILNKTSAGFGCCLSINFWMSCCDFSQQKILWVPTCILFVEKIHPITQLTHQVKVCITAIGKDFSFKMVNMPQQRGLLSSSASSELQHLLQRGGYSDWLLDHLHQNHLGVLKGCSQDQLQPHSSRINRDGAVALSKKIPQKGTLTEGGCTVKPSLKILSYTQRSLQTAPY